MKFANYHTHTPYCDGRAEAESFVKKALELEFSALGFSSHAPLPYENEWTMKEDDVSAYIDEIRQLKKRYENELKIYVGMEIDFIPDVMGPSSPEFEELNLDYTIGSVHSFFCNSEQTYLEIDDTEDKYISILNDVFNGSPKKFVEGYYSRLRMMALEHKPDIVGHFDLIKRNNPNGRFFTESEDWYREEVHYTLEALSKSDSVVEINTGGLARSKTKEPYPSPWIIENCLDYNIPLTLSSDAHLPEHLDFHFRELLTFLRDIGYRELMFLNEKGWEPQTIPAP